MNWNIFVANHIGAEASKNESASGPNDPATTTRNVKKKKTKHGVICFN